MLLFPKKTSNKLLKVDDVMASVVIEVQASVKVKKECRIFSRKTSKAGHTYMQIKYAKARFYESRAL